MSHQPMLVVAALSMVLMVTSCSRPPAPESPPSAMTALPDSAAGWTAAGPVEHWDTETIYDYIDGHAEVYLSYGMRGCTSQRYAGPEGEAGLVADVFEMASDADAFGVFTHDRDGDEVQIGQGGLYRWGWLSFWKGRFFVSVTAEDETGASKAAVLELGRLLAASITESGEVPALVAALPAAGLEPRSVRYLRHPLVLASHLPVGLGDPFGLGGSTPAVLGRYLIGETTAWLLVVDYPDEEIAATVVGSRGEGQAAAARALAGKGSRAAFVLETDDPELAAGLLDAAAAAVAGGGR